MVDVPAWIGTGRQQRARFAFQEFAFVHHLEIVDENTFLIDVRAVGRSRTGRSAANVRVMPARSDDEDDLRARFIEHRRNHSHVREVGSPIVGRVEDEDIAGAHRAGILADDCLH